MRDFVLVLLFILYMYILTETHIFVWPNSCHSSTKYMSGLDG